MGILVFIIHIGELGVLLVNVSTFMLLFSKKDLLIWLNCLRLLFIIFIVFNKFDF